MPDSVVRRSLLVVMLGCLGGASVAHAASFDPLPGADAAVGNTLRAAILAANATPEDDVVTLIAGTYEISLPNAGVQENLGATGDLDVLQGTVTIVGAGAGSSVIRVLAGVDRAFQVAGATLILRDLSVEDGLAHDDGSAAAPGTTPAAGGGVLCSSCTLELVGVTLADNTAQGGDGAIDLEGDGTDGHDAFGGGVHAAGATVRLGAGTRFAANRAIGGSGGDGLDEGGDNLFAAGSGGSGGAARGGGLSIGDTLVVSGPIVFLDNQAVGGAGGIGGDAPDGPAGDGGAGGEARGGALHAPHAPFPAGTQFGGDAARGGHGGDRGEGLIPGAGGAGGFAAGGGAWVEGATPSTMTGVIFDGEQAVGGNGGAGDFFVDDGDRGDGGDGGASRGGALAIHADLTLVGVQLLDQVAQGGAGGSAGTEPGVAGAGGDCAGGALAVLAGSVELRVSRATGNRCLGGAAGSGGRASGFSTGTPGGLGGAALGGAFASLAPTSQLLVVDSELAGNDARAGDGGDGGSASGGEAGAGGPGGSVLGGGIYTATGDLEVRNSTLSANRALGAPGGIGNSGLGGGGDGGDGSDARGGNLFTSVAGIALNNSTLNLGVATAGLGGAGGGFGGSPGSPGDEAGGNLAVGQGTTSAITSTILANGTGGVDPDLAGSVNGCRSLVETIGPGGTQALACDVTHSNTVDPQLLPLAFNGGTTRTHAFPATSFVLDRGTNPLALPFDQRGAPFPRVAGGEADIGAFELAANQLAAVSVTVAPSSVPEAGPGDLVYTFVRTDSQGAPLGLPLTICYTIGGTASPASDYTGFNTGGACLANGTVTFTAGSATATVTITPEADAVPEPAESVVFTVVAGAGYAPTAPNAATGLIVEPTTLAAIPTLGEWALLVLAMLLGGLAIRRLAGA